MRIYDPALKKSVAKAMSDPNVREIVSATIPTAKSATELSAQLGISVRSVYRYAKDLSRLGILTAQSWALLHRGGKHTLFRSMVKSITVKYEGNTLEVDLEPNDGILERFMRFWTYMGR